jgi:hypothetical protein
MKRGDVIVVRFPHPSGQRGKKRPAVVVQSDTYTSTVSTVVVAEVTKNLTMKHDPACLFINLSTRKGKRPGYSSIRSFPVWCSTPSTPTRLPRSWEAFRQHCRRSLTIAWKSVWGCRSSFPVGEDRRTRRCSGRAACPRMEFQHGPRAAERAWRQALRFTTARADREFLRRRLAVCRPDGGEPATE